MSVSRNIRSIWVTDYDKSIGDVVTYLASGSGSDPVAKTLNPFSTTTYDRSTTTGVTEIVTGSYFWGQSEESIPGNVSAADLDEDLTAGETTVETTDGQYFSSGGGYILIEDEIIYYATKSTDDLTSCIRGALGTTDVQHDGTASTIKIWIYQRGIVQSIDYDPEDEVYAVRVALGATGTETPSSIYSYYIYRFEFPKRVVDLVNYEDVESPTTISGTIPGY